MPDNLTISIEGLQDLENRIDNLSAKLSVALNRKETKMATAPVLNQTTTGKISQVIGAVVDVTSKASCPPSSPRWRPRITA
ncbi:MAG: hypothetical protein HGA70_05730, partial [Chlorobiaceae bacterium]|nr:hypothetical protein [Chlorobiaceae bacterium]